jgi:hypothetical protein
MVADMARDATAKGVESWPANLRIDPEVSACGNTSGWSYPERDVCPAHTCQEIFFNDLVPGKICLPGSVKR